jgi:flagellar protein FlaF
MQPGDPKKDMKAHAAAADAYGTNVQKNTPDQRELEAHVLLKSAKFLQDLQNDWDNVTPDILEETLRYNRQIWVMFYDNAIQNPEGDRPNDLRSNIINLANFIFKRELEIMGTPEKGKLDVLVNINREIAAGLMIKPQDEQKNESTKKPSKDDGLTDQSA